MLEIKEQFKILLGNPGFKSEALLKMIASRKVRLSIYC